MKKFFLLSLSLLILFTYTGCKERYEPAPKITEGEFPFVLEYEMNGERYLIEDTVVCEYAGYGVNNFAIFGYPTSRTWNESLKSGDESKSLLIEFEPNTESLLVKGRINEKSMVSLNYGRGGYYLGDPDEKSHSPSIRYYETYRLSKNHSVGDYTDLTNEQLEKYFGIKIIRLEFSKPIKNTFK